MLFFVIKVITHAQLGSCSLPQQGNTDLLTRPYTTQPIRYTYPCPSARKSIAAVVPDAITGRRSQGIAAASACFPEREHPAPNSSAARAEGNRPANPRSSSPGLQRPSIPALSRASPLAARQGTPAGSGSGFSYKSGSWLPAQAPAQTRVCCAGRTGERG